MRSREHRKKRAGQARGREPGRRAGAAGTRWRRWRRARREAGPRTFPSAPTARGRPGQDRGSPGSAAGGEGSGREGRGGCGPAHYAKRPPPLPPPPRGKGKRPRSVSAASMAAWAFPPPHRGPARPGGLLLPQGRAPQQPRSRSRVCGGRPRHGGQGAGRAGAGGQEPGGSSGRDAAAGRCGTGRWAGPYRRRGRGGTALCYCFCQ